MRRMRISNRATFVSDGRSWTIFYDITIVWKTGVFDFEIVFPVGQPAESWNPFQTVGAAARARAHNETKSRLCGAKTGAAATRWRVPRENKRGVVSLTARSCGWRAAAIDRRRSAPLACTRPRLSPHVFMVYVRTHSKDFYQLRIFFLNKTIQIEL